MQPDYKRLFEAAPALFMVLAPDPPRFTIVAASDGYLRAVRKRREDFVGRPVFEALPVGPDDQTSEVNSRASFQRVIDRGVPDAMGIQRHDLERPAAEGGGFETHHWSALNAPAFDDDGRVAFIIHRVEDVTELVEARQKGEAQQALADALRTRTGAMELEIYQRAQEIQEMNRSLRTANERLGALDRAKTVFFSNISHELRTPLTLILGTLEGLLEKDEMPAEKLEELEVAHRNGLRLLKLVNTLLEFSRIEAGRADATFRPTDLGALTAELASSFESACERGGVHLVVRCPPSPPVYVDRKMWEKIVLNLVSNAFKFTLAGEVEVHVGTAEEHAELVVRDTGSGIPKEELPRIFERFHRVAGTRGRSVEGTGIGLSLVEQLVKLHGGTISAESEVGRGTTFRVRVPLGTAHLPADHVDTSEETRSPSASARPFVEEALHWLPDVDEARPEHRSISELAAPADERPADATERRPRVLLADDNADMRRYVRRLLAPHYDVVAVGDGQAALARTRSDRPDLVLTDVMMPKLDGFGLLRAIRGDAELRTTPVVMISARAGEEAKGEGLEAGADDYLVKPFSARELLARVSTNLRLAQMREEVARSTARAEALEETSRRKNEFLAMLSHELRNPLAPIRNSLYILERAVPGGEQAKRAQEVIDRQVAHLARMVEDLLDVSRITQGKMQVQRERLELGELVRGVAEDARASFDRNGIEFRLELGREPLFVSGDPARLAQVVGNILNNAVKFTPRGGHVRLSVHSDGAEQALISVKDDGAGMTKDVLDHLFQPFVQADRTLDRSAGGLGLGLAVVKGLIDAHGGTVTAASEGPGRGAEIVVRLPLRERLRPQLTVIAAPMKKANARRVLIIEDKPDAAASLREALELDGHEVEVAHDGRRGVEKARAIGPDVILCDIGMPEMDGYAVARAIRADPNLCDTVMVAVTGYAALEDVERSREAGFDHHLPKPPDLATLAKLLDERTPSRTRASS